MLDSALEKATEENGIRTLCRHAALVAHIAGDRRREIRYTENARAERSVSLRLREETQAVLRRGGGGLNRAAF
jgi:hypothetical protein